MSTQTEQLPSAMIAGPGAGSLKPSFGVPTIISVFSSSGQARDWFVILVIGSILGHMRSVFTSVWTNLVNRFWITVTLEDWDDSYCESHSSFQQFIVGLTDHRIGWMMLWLSKKPEWTGARELSINTHSFGVGAIATLAEGETDDDPEHRIRFSPSYSRSASLWYRGHYIRLSRSRVADGFYAKDVLTMK